VSDEDPGFVPSDASADDDEDSDEFYFNSLEDPDPLDYRSRDCWGKLGHHGHSVNTGDSVVSERTDSCRIQAACHHGTEVPVQGDRELG